MNLPIRKSKEKREKQNTYGLRPEYKTYEHQKCFVGHSHEATWCDDILNACVEVLPEFELEPWYASEHFDSTKPLRNKVVQLIANTCYGIYDISSWQDKCGKWYLPRNVFIELGMAIALNRPVFIIRHTCNNFPLPECLQGVDLLEFAGATTLKNALNKNLPQWLNVPPDRNWLNRFCLFGNQTCNFRETHPRSLQWGNRTICCHVSDGLDTHHPDFQVVDREEIYSVFEDVFSRYSDLTIDYLHEFTITDGYQFLLCSYCRAVHSDPFAIYRILPDTPAEIFIVIGMSIALETLFEYHIPKILLVRQEQDLPSLLRGYEVLEAVNSSEIKQKLKVHIPAVIQEIRKTTWKPRKLPFIEASVLPEEVKPPTEPVTKLVYVLIVDDNPEYRQKLSELFRAIGCEPREAATNAQALEILSRSDLSFSLVTTDILRRPEREGEDGYLGLELARTINDKLPVVFVTRHSPDWIKKQAPELLQNHNEFDR